MRSTIGSKGSQ